MLGGSLTRQPASVGRSSTRSSIRQQPQHTSCLCTATPLAPAAAARRWCIAAACRSQQQDTRQRQHHGSRPCSSTSRHRQLLPRRGAAVRVMALDAAQPFDFEHRMSHKLTKDKQLKIGIVGFGTFGQFLAKRMVAAGHRVLATSRTPYYAEAAALGAEFYEDADDFCEEHPDVVVLASSILSTDKVLRSLPLARLKRSTLVVDVLSVKVFPKQLLLSLLPPEFDVLCTHPMFGPDSGKGSWEGLNFMYDAVRVGRDAKRQARVDNFLAFFRQQGCRMVEMTCEEHDRQAASTQFVTHTVGRMLGAMQLGSTDINTRGFEALLQLVENTNHDSFDLYYGLFLYNANATEELERLEQAFDVVKKQLFGRLHAIARQNLLPDPSAAAAAPAAGGDAAAAPAASNGGPRRGARGASSGTASPASSSALASRGSSKSGSVGSLASLAAAPAGLAADAVKLVADKLQQAQEQAAANGGSDAAGKRQ